MKTLSANNQTNVAGTFHDADVLVEMSGISKQWSTKTRTSYETRILDISPIRLSVNPVGGLAAVADFTITLQMETPTQFIQDNDVDGETVEVSLQYGADAKITLAKGILNRWEIVTGGKLRLYCTGDLELNAATLPLEQINTTNFSTFDIPPRLIGSRVPLTIGAHDRAKGVLIDKAIASGSTDGQKVKFNSEISGHDGIGGLTNGLVYAKEVEQFCKINEDGISAPTVTEKAAGHFVIERGSGNTEASHGRVEFLIYLVPRTATGDTGMDNPENAIDEDFETHAEADDIAPAQSTETTYLRGELPDLPFPETTEVRNASWGLNVLTDLERDPAINASTRSSETLDAAIELDKGTFPVSGVLIEDVLADGETSFDNLNEMDGAEVGVSLSVASYRVQIGLDKDNDGTNDYLPVKALSNRNLTLRYTEQDILPGGGSDELLQVMEWRLRVCAVEAAGILEFFGDLEGYDDDGSGTYTGVVNALIENPADVLHFILAEILGFSGITTADFTTARTALGDYVIAGQVLELESAKAVLDRIARQGKLKLFRDVDDQWACKAFAIPSTADRTLDQSDGDFVGDNEDGTEGEIRKITQTRLSDVYNQFEVLYDWNSATGAYDSTLTLDETAVGPVGDWLTESQGRYNVTRKLTVSADWIRSENVARSFGNYLIYMHADRKRIVTWQTSWNCVDVELGDRIQLNHTDMMLAEDTTVFAGYREDSPLATIEAGYTDPDTSAVIKAGAKVQLYEGRHQYEVNTIETLPMEGKIRFTGRQVDFSRSPLPEPT